MKKNPAGIILLFVFLSAPTGAQVNTEPFRVATEKLGFSVRSELNFTLMAGNTDFQYLGTNTRFNYNWGSDYSFLAANGGFGQSDGESFFSQALIHLRNVHKVSRRVRLEEFIQYNNDRKLLLQHRYLLGGGFRLKIIDREKVEFRIGNSFFFEYEAYDLEPESEQVRDKSSLRLSTYVTVELGLKNDVSVISTSYVQPDTEDINDVRILSNSGLKVKLSSKVDLTAECNIRYDSRPVEDIKKFDLMTKLGIALNLQ